MTKKTEIASALVIMFDMPTEYVKQFEKMSLPALEGLLEGVRKNALAYDELRATLK